MSTRSLRTYVDKYYGEKILLATRVTPGITNTSSIRPKKGPDDAEIIIADPSASSCE